MTNTQLKEYAVKNSWNVRHGQSNGLDGPGNYSGTDFGNKVIVIAQGRDSDLVSQSNFAVALDMLGGESDMVEVARIGHWACGWIQVILVNPTSKKWLKVAYEISQKLEDYPILDESDYYERQNEAFSDYAESARDDLAQALSMHFGLKNTRVLKSIAYDLNMEEQNQNGEDSCINVYDCRKPGKRDIERLKDAMENMNYNHSKSKVFKALKKAVDSYKV